MADRYPLIIDPSSNQIKEIPSGDGLDLTGAKISSVTDINATGIITAAQFSGPITGNISGNASGLVGSPNIVVGDITASGNISCAGTITYDDVTSVDSVGIVTAREDLKVLRNFSVSGLSTFTGALDINSNVDIDGHTELDNVNIAGVATAIRFDGEVNALKFDTTTTGVVVTGVATATSFSGPLTGNVTGNLSGDIVGTRTLGTGVTVTAAGVVSATTYYGSGANLTGIDSLTDSGGTIKVQANSTGVVVSGIATADNFKTGFSNVHSVGFDVVSSTGAGSTIRESGNAVFSGIVTASQFKGDGSNLINLPASGKGANLFINGDMRVDQRYGGVAHTIDGSDHVMDRWLFQDASTQEHITVQQVDVTADTDPWNEGFRKAAKITNGNQTGGAGADDTIIQYYKFEAQDIANSGWDYTSASSYITLTFWVKASVAMDYPFYIRTRDGSAQMYSMMTGSLTANTWTKITKTLPGNSNITVDNDTGPGLELNIAPYYGTDGTVSSGSILNAWKAWTSSSRWNDITTTWYTTNDATFETTGFKLEVGDSATDFDFKTYADDLYACQRYCYVVKGPQNSTPPGNMGWYSGSDAHFNFRFPRAMNKAPVFTPSGTWRLNSPAGNGSNQTSGLTFIQVNDTYDGGTFALASPSTAASNGDSCYLQFRGSGTKFVFDAEI